MIKIQNYINGELIAPVNGAYIDNYEPATGEVYSQIPDSDSDDMHAAINAAKAAFPHWSGLSIQERSNFLLAISDGIQSKLEAFAQAESRDNGKPLKLATVVDIPRAVSNFKFFGQAITQFSSESHAMGSTAINYTLRNPLGVVGCISPWNLPLYLFSWKIAPALATGNTVVAKTIRSYAHDSIPVIGSMPRSRSAEGCIKYSSWTRTQNRRRIKYSP